MILFPLAQLLEKDNSVTIHKRNNQTLAVELYKVVNGSATEIRKEVFPVKLNTRYPSKLEHCHICICHLIPDSIMNASSLKEFKTKIKEWKVINCPCRIYVPQVGFVNFPPNNSSKC